MPPFPIWELPYLTQPDDFTLWLMSLLEFSLMLQPYATKVPGFMGGLPKAV